MGSFQAVTGLRLVGFEGWFSALGCPSNQAPSPVKYLPFKDTGALNLRTQYVGTWGVCISSIFVPCFFKRG